MRLLQFALALDQNRSGGCGEAARRDWFTPLLSTPNIWPASSTIALVDIAGCAITDWGRIVVRMEV